MLPSNALKCCKHLSHAPVCPFGLCCLRLRGIMTLFSALQQREKDFFYCILKVRASFFCSQGKDNDINYVSTAMLPCNEHLLWRQSMHIMLLQMFQCVVCAFHFVSCSFLPYFSLTLPLSVSPRFMLQTRGGLFRSYLLVPYGFLYCWLY